MTDESLFAQAVAIPDAAERAAFLDRACTGADQRREVGELLAAHFAAAGFMEPVPGATAEFVPGSETHTGPADPDRTVTRLTPALGSAGLPDEGALIAGRYRLGRLLGEGGMGSVYLAEQLEPVKRQVALKLIRPGMDTARVIARFEAERQALAVMDHPNIARVLDGGTTDAGRPFFVMELVQGVPLTDYCDAKRLPVAARLDLFVQVCQAVQHAHQKGIIHRDLKPSNILVTEVDGRAVPKVIDFGLAKALQANAIADVSLDVTAAGSVMGTPLYMAPEQADGASADIDTRADVYALGTILYELLTGSTPIERSTIRGAALAAIVRVIREVEPPTPVKRLQTSEGLPGIAAVRRIEPAKLSELVRGDLEWIVMKCLEKDRARRYDTANALAADVQRFQADEPVSAGPPSWRYRARKFVKRNRSPVVAVGLVFVALVAGVTGTTAGMLLARAAEARVTTALNDLATEEGKTRAVLAQVTDEKKNTQAALERVTAEEKNTQSALGRERELTAKLTASVASEALALRETVAALDTLTDDVIEDMFVRQAALTEKDKQFLRTVLGFYDRRARDQGDAADARFARAMGYVRIGQIRQRLGDLPAAEAALRESATALARLVTAPAPPAAHRQGLAIARQWLGMVLVERGRGADAEVEYKLSVSASEELVAAFPTAAHYRLVLAKTRNNLGTLRSAAGDSAGATGWFRLALADFQKLAADHPAEAEYSRSVAGACNNLGMVANRQGRPAEAVEWYEKAIPIFRRLVEKDPRVPAYRLHLGQAHSNAALARYAGRLPGVQADHVHAVNILERLYADFPLAPEYGNALGNAHGNFASFLLLIELPASAGPHLQRAIAVRTVLANSFPDNPEYAHKLAVGHGTAGLLSQRTGQLVEAAKSYAAARAIWERLAASHKDVTDYAVNLSGCYVNSGNLEREQGRPADALPWYDKAIGRLETVLKVDPNEATARLFLRNANAAKGTTLGALGRFADALPHAERAAELAVAASRPQYILARGRARILAGKVTGGVADVDWVLKRDRLLPWLVADAAEALSLASREEKAVDGRDEHAKRAVALLRVAKAGGLFADPNEVRRLKLSPDFAPVRTRDDFRQLLAEIDGTTRPVPKPVLAPEPHEVVNR